MWVSSLLCLRRTVLGVRLRVDSLRIEMCRRIGCRGMTLIRKIFIYSSMSIITKSKRWMFLKWSSSMKLCTCRLFRWARPGAQRILSSVRKASLPWRIVLFRRPTNLSCSQNVPFKKCRKANRFNFCMKTLPVPSFSSCPLYTTQTLIRKTQTIASNSHSVFPIVNASNLRCTGQRFKPFWMTHLQRKVCRFKFSSNLFRFPIWLSKLQFL